MLEILKPVSSSLIDFTTNLAEHTLGKNMLLHSENFFPELEKGMLVMLSVPENRNSSEKENEICFENVRKQLYQLAKGDWVLKIADLGVIEPGEKVLDTYFALTEIIKELLAAGCIPIVLGGGQDLVQSQYKAYDPKNGTVNMVSVDSSFDLGNVDLPISNKSYVGKIVMGQPYNLFNYTNIGYQSYYISPEEIDLMDKMYFEAYRLGEVSANMSIVEPSFRDADIVSLDLGSLSAPFFGSQPNGFSAKEICTLSRYAGISDKVSNFGVYEYDSKKSSVITDALAAQIIWYFIEGVSCRWGETGEIDKMDVIYYQVPIDGEIYSFYKSRLTERWWLKVTYSNPLNNNIPIDALLPCTYEDYEKACNQIVPEKWYNAKMKLEM